MSKDRQFIIIEATSDSLRLHFLIHQGGAIDCVETQSFVPGDIQSETSSLLDQLVLDAAAAAIRARDDWRTAELICLIGGGDVACHYFDMPPLNGAVMKDAVRLKLDEQLHFSIDEAIFDVTRIIAVASNKEELVPIRASAIRTETADAALAFSRQINRPLLALSAAPVALSELALRTKKIDADPRAVLYVSESGSTLLVSSGDRQLLTAELPVGMRDFTAALMRPIIAGDDVLQLEEEQAVALRNEVGIPAGDLDIELYKIKGKNLLPLLEPAMQRFVQQLTQWLTFVSTHENGKKVDRLFVVGAGGAMPGLTDTLAKRLKIETSQADWLAGISGPSSRVDSSCESVAAAISAVKFFDKLPDLMPESERKRRRVARLRSTTTKAGPVIAAATLGVAFLFNQVGGRLSRAVGDVNNEQTRVQSVIDRNLEVQHQQQLLNDMRGEFETFSRATPDWLGLFKELSLILPRELRVTRLSTRNDASGLRLNVEGEIIASAPGQSTDEVVEDALTALERSPFASAVNLVNLSRGRTASGADGTVAVELTLAYRKPEVPQPK